MHTPDVHAERDYVGHRRMKGSFFYNSEQARDYSLLAGGLLALSILFYLAK